MPIHEIIAAIAVDVSEIGALCFVFTMPIISFAYFDDSSAMSLNVLAIIGSPGSAYG